MLTTEVTRLDRWSHQAGGDRWRHDSTGGDTEHRQVETKQVKTPSRWRHQAGGYTKQVKTLSR